MALTKTQPQTPASDAAAAVTSVGSFEAMDETTTGTPAANDPPFEPTTPPAATAAAPAPAQAPVTAIAVKPAGTVAVKADTGAFAREVAEMKGAANFEYGNFDVFKGNNGEIMVTNGLKLGRWVKVSMVAWDEHTEISPGSKSDKSKGAVGYSKDGLTIDHIIDSKEYGDWVGRKVDDYVNFLRSSDYPEAKKSKFVDVAAVVHDTDSAAGKAKVGEVIQVTLTQTSIPSFAKYQEQLNMKAKAFARGIPGIKLPENPFDFYFLREVTTKGDNTWTKLKVVTTLPTDL